MKLKLLIALFLVLITYSNTYSQVLTQNIRGVVSDKGTGMPLAGVNVFIPELKLGATSDADGFYYLENIPVGRVSLSYSFLGFGSQYLNKISLITGKELVLNIQMEESISALYNVVVTAKQENINQYESNLLREVGVKEFSFEETNKFAGSLGDPSRMATNFAGVQASSDARNDIIIRGNSPMGLLWRLNDFNIPNPNHFGSLGTTGGPVSILNNNLLDKSKFLIGAFPAEYSNAISGVFDLELRTGNTTKHEFLGQIGFNGFELGAEGPFSKNSRSTYLLSARYSTLDLLTAMGLNFGWSAVPQYKDITFIADIPLGRKLGKINVFAMAGTSYIELLKKDKEEEDFSASQYDDTYFGSSMGVLGVSHLLFLSDNTKQKIGISIDGILNETKVDSLNRDDTFAKQIYGQKSSEVNISAFYKITSKLGKKDILKTGVYVKQVRVNLLDSVYNQLTDSYRLLTNTDGKSILTNAYINLQHKFTDKIVLNTGLNGQHLALNNSISIEPRVGLKYGIGRYIFSTGYGLVSQTQPMSAYFIETLDQSTGNYYRTNTQLDFVISHHFNLGIERGIFDNWNIKTQLYYQHIYNAAVEQQPSYYSLLNQGASFYTPIPDSLFNGGTGKNYGIDVTVEKYLSDNYYILATASLYESKYKGSDGIERNTAFNGNYSFNFVFGYEYFLFKSNNHVINTNIRYTQNGGNRFIPIDLDESKLNNYTVYDYDNAFESRYPYYARLDFRISYKMLMEKISFEWAIDIQNILNRKNIFQEKYDPNSGEIVTEYQTGIFPMFTFRVYF